jgi:DNA-binding SARP family transcriptional activator
VTEISRSVHCRLEVRVLGPVEAVIDGARVELGKPQHRVILGILSLENGRAMPTDRIVDLLWSERPPRNARAIVHSRISELRSALGRSAAIPPIATVTGGYRLQLPPDSVDAHRFRRLTDQSRRGAASTLARDALREALGLWRGSPFGGLLPRPSHSTLCHGLEAIRRTAREELYELELRIGNHQTVVDEVAELAAALPTSERLVASLMRALHLTGRTAEALAAYERCRETLDRELGIDPGLGLRTLHVQILRGQLRAPTGPGWVPAQLPADAHGFTGREQELSALDTRLTRHEGTAARIAMLAGPAGVGKTALAVRWAHQRRSAFPDGQLYADLRGYAHERPVSPHDLLARFLRALGDPGPFPSETDELAARYRTALDGRRVLVLLDNAASVEQVRPLLPGSPTSAVIVTSRDQLPWLAVRHGAVRLDLDLLAPSAAVDLLATLIGARVTAEPEGAATLAERCGYLPLALRVVAQRAALAPGLTMAELADRGQPARPRHAHPPPRLRDFAGALAERALSIN